MSIQIQPLKFCNKTKNIKKHWNNSIHNYQAWLRNNATYDSFRLTSVYGNIQPLFMHGLHMGFSHQDDSVEDTSRTDLIFIIYIHNISIIESLVVVVDLLVEFLQSNQDFNLTKLGINFFLQIKEYSPINML